jgi:hypothetical protein
VRTMRTPSLLTRRPLRPMIAHGSDNVTKLTLTFSCVLATLRKTSSGATKSISSEASKVRILISILSLRSASDIASDDLDYRERNRE